MATLFFFSFHFALNKLSYWYYNYGYYVNIFLLFLYYLHLYFVYIPIQTFQCILHTLRALNLIWNYKACFSFLASEEIKIFKKDSIERAGWAVAKTSYVMSEGRLKNVTHTWTINEIAFDIGKEINKCMIIINNKTA